MIRARLRHYPDICLDGLRKPTKDLIWIPNLQNKDLGFQHDLYFMLWFLLLGGGGCTL
jgi:hypothetical protein